ncbi:hypothetical protein HWC53_gp142 [Bacillus phage vB_BmeM-Goe8]|uniref:Uncharacterized protein n=1 Tax=Bacillus phage vB_BmeM-Goe8 TaxID=2593638 RepID=A0A516KMZ3_9CAUD|nr:hypothetical protein HWC53_gp142 [Bacillus phage vB_BmeM-Goe8]QDP42947.1 hypothetical protein Goe8_c01740 [Bacillus phage vB_BmeM-Goe8]
MKTLWLEGLEKARKEKIEEERRLAWIDEVNALGDLPLEYPQKERAPYPDEQDVKKLTEIASYINIAAKTLQAIDKEEAEGKLTFEQAHSRRLTANMYLDLYTTDLAYYIETKGGRP